MMRSDLLAEINDQSSVSVQHGLQSVQKVCKHTGKDRIAFAVVDFADHQRTNQGQQGLRR